MPDPLNLSLWLRGFATLAMPSLFEKAIARFPVSRLQPYGVLRVTPFDLTEAPVLERIFDDAGDAAEMREAAQEFLHEDCAFSLAASWDLWQWDGEWQLRPAPVLIEIYGPRFESDYGEQIRLDLGPEGLYLPDGQRAHERVPVQSNIRSVLHLAADLAQALPVEKKLLWSESEDNFAARLEKTLAE